MECLTTALVEATQGGSHLLTPTAELQATQCGSCYYTLSAVQVHLYHHLSLYYCFNIPKVP